MSLKKKDLLFGNVWQTFLIDPFAKAKFLESLETYILSDQLRNIPVEITQEFVNHYETVKKYESLEACITHMTLTSLDLHQVMSLCWLYGLYDAIIYIYNNGMLDYVTPTEELMSQLTNAMNSSESLSQQQVDLGNKILVYISCCLAGRAYPYGDIEKSQVPKVKYDVYTCLTTLHTKKALDDELTYPYLRTLLIFDTQGLLNVISIAFDEPEFNTEMGRCQKQRLVDILLQIMVQGEGYSPTQVGCLFTFLARQIVRGDQGSLNVSRDLFEQVLAVLTGTDDNTHKEERQQALLDMLNAGGIQYFDREKLIFQAEQVKFFRILEMLYEEGKEYDKVLRCLLDDRDGRQEEALAFVQKVLMDDHYDEVAKGQVEKAVLKYIEELINLTPKKASMVIFFHMYSYIPLVINKLQTKPKVLYNFLKHSLECKDQGSQPSTPVHNANKADYVDPLTSSDTLEQYLDLMCKWEPQIVPSYLKQKLASFSVGKALKICKEHSLVEAQAFLLEKDDRQIEAFELLKTQVNDNLSSVGQEKDSAAKVALEWNQVNTSVMLCVQLCQRSGSKLQEDEIEGLWFSLLDSLLQSQRSKVDIGESLDGIKSVVNHVVNSAIGYVPLRKIIEKILQVKKNERLIIIILT